MGKDAHELREEIEETRGRMGDTVDAIAYKADVPSRVGEAIGDRVDAVKSTITGSVGGLRHRMDGVRDKVGDMVPDMDDVQQRAASAAGAVRENPLGLLIGAAAIGFLLGSLLPGTRLEEERLGPIGDQLKEQAKERVQETISTAREVATQAVTQAMTTASHSQT